MPPGLQARLMPCSILLKVVRGGTMEPIASRVPAGDRPHAAGQSRCLQHAPWPERASHFFTGGGIHEITDRLRNGTVTIPNAPARFSFNADFGNDRGSGFRRDGPPLRRAADCSADGRPESGGDRAARGRLALDQIRQVSMNWMFAIAPLLIVWPALAAERLTVDLVDQKVVLDRLEQGQVSEGHRESTIAEMFRSAGCEVELQKVSRNTNNVICTLKGESSDSIVVGGHYDFVPLGQGIIDDWSGTSTCWSPLYQALKGAPAQTYVSFCGVFEGGDRARRLQEVRSRA